MSKDYKDAPNPLIGAFAKACDNNQADAFVNKFVSYNSGATAIGVKINPTPTTKDHTASQELQQLRNLKDAQLAIITKIITNFFTAKWVSTTSPSVKADNLKGLSDHIVADAVNLAQITQQPNILKYATTLTADDITDPVKAATVMLTSTGARQPTAANFAPGQYKDEKLVEEFTKEAQKSESDITNKIVNLDKFYKGIGTADEDKHAMYCDATDNTLKGSTKSGTTAAATADAAMSEITTFLPLGTANANDPCITVTPADVVTAFNNLANTPDPKITDTSKLADAKTAVGAALYTTDNIKLLRADLEDLTNVDATTQSYFSALACLDDDSACDKNNVVTKENLVKVINQAAKSKLSGGSADLNAKAIQDDGLATTLTTPVLKYVVKNLKQEDFFVKANGQPDNTKYNLNSNNLLQSTDPTQNTKLSDLTDAYCPTGDNKCVANLDKYIKEVVWAKKAVGDALTANDNCATATQTDPDAACVKKLKSSATLLIDTLQADELDAYTKCVAGSTDADLKCDA